MKASELRQKTHEELEIELGNLKSELFKLRFQLATNQLDNTTKLKYVRKDIARVLTVMKDMELKGR